MPSNVYCPFCGIILLSDPYSDDTTSLKPRDRPWYAEIRGIYSANFTFGDIAITGLGIIRFRNTLYAPLGNDLSYVDVGTEALEEWRICEPSEGRWCFGFHNSCWRLLLLRLGHGQDDCFKNDDFQNETTIAESVFYQLYCTPCLDASSFEFGHDYEGAAQTHKSFGRPKAVELSSHFYADPCAIPSINDLKATTFDFYKARGGSLWEGQYYARSMTGAVTGIDYHNERGASCPLESGEDRDLLRFPNDVKEERSKKLETPKNHFLNALSPELKYEIFSYLPFDELLNMRLVCQNLALLAAVNTLPQLYWRSRFLLGQEADFLFPRLADKRDWAQLFFWTRASLRARLLPLVNRKRIRQLIEPIAALVDQQVIFQNGPCGSVSHPVQSQGNCFQLVEDESAGKTPRLMEIFGSFSGQLASIGADSPLNEGCRVLHHRTQRFMPLQRIGISTVQIGARNFISGMNLFLPGHKIGYPIGYHIPAFEKWMEIPSSSHVKALCVAFCSGGLTGIKFIFTNSDSSDWVGDSNGPGIAQGILRVPERSDQYCLLAGLDHFKIVSLGLGKLDGHAEAPVKLPSQRYVQSHLWTPRHPTHEDLIISKLLPSEPSRAFEPRINIDFGGSRGVLLGLLTRLTFHMTSSPYPLIGIEIIYSDGKSLLFGSNGGCEISFFINGANGERINQVGVLEENQMHHSTSGLGGLQISTNYGRSANFAPLRSRLYASVELLPSFPPGNTITGFVSLEANEHHFSRVGIQSQPCEKQPMVPDITDHKRHSIPDGQLEYDEKFIHFIDSSNPGNYQTYASLKNVRKIQASMGIQGRSRSPNHISGLRLEYYDHPSPGIVGQWMDELDDGFEISPDEKVKSLTIWLTPMGFSTECQGMETGQVTAIHIETTRSRSVTFHSPGFHTLPPRKLQDQYQSDTGEELAAISWIFNVSSDRIRAVVSGDRSQRSQMVPEQHPPFDQVQKLYFETQSDDGCKETMVTAEAYFRDRAIVGLVFVYSSGRRASIGDFDVATRQTVRFSQDAQIVGLSVAATEHELMEIEFEIGWNEQPRYEKLRLSIASPDDPANTAGYDWRDVWCRDAMSAESYQRLLARDRVYKPPRESRLVGIYVGCQEISRVGALYEPKVSQEI